MRYFKLFALISIVFLLLGVTILIFSPEQDLAGQIFIGGSLSIFVIMLFVYLLRQDISDRDKEEEHRNYFKRHGKWLD